MVRDKMDKVFSSKTFYIIFSLVAAITLWLYVAYDTNPDTTIPVSGLTIDYSGASSLSDKNLIITDIDVDTITLRFTGKRQNVSKLITSLPTVTVDLSVITGAGSYQIPYDVGYPSDVDANAIHLSGGSVDYITVYVEKLLEKQVIVDGIYNGGTQTGYSAEPVEFSPEYVLVSGPEAIVSKIEKAWVNIVRENLSKTVQEDMTYVLLDKNGDEVVSDHISVDKDMITVTIPVVMEKEVALTANVIYGAGATNENTTVKIEPSNITLTGDAGTLTDFNQILLGTIDLTKFPATTSEKFTIAIPNGTNNVTGTSEATVTVEIVGLSTMRLSATNIQIKNNTEGYTANLITQSLDVALRGPQAQLDQVTADNVWIEADLSDLGKTTGSFTVAAKVYVNGFADVGAIGDYKVSVTITKG